MTTLIKLFYAGAITALLILLVAFGVRTFYEPPEQPRFPEPSVGFRPVAPALSDTTQIEPTPEQRAYEDEQRRYQEEFRRYAEKRAPYRRNVFLVAAAIGIAAVAAALALDPRLDAMRLGVVTGGLGTLLYGVIQANGDLDESGPALIFAVALIGLALILGAGYRWLTARPSDS